MVEKKFELTKEQENIIKEVGGVGAGHAVTALTKMTGLEAKMTVTAADITHFTEIPKMIKTIEETVFSAYTPILGVISGSILIITPRTSGYMLIDMVLGNPPGTTKYLDEMGESALKETQNIIGNAYLTALNDFMGITLIPSVPRIASIFRDDIDAIIKKGIKEQIEYVLVINSDFSVKNAKGAFLMVIALESIESMIKAIKERIGGALIKNEEE